MSQFLCDDILIEVFEFFEPNLIIKDIGFVCKQWNELSRVPYLWKFFALRYFKNNFGSEENRNKVILREKLKQCMVNLLPKEYKNNLYPTQDRILNQVLFQLFTKNASFPDLQLPVIHRFTGVSTILCSIAYGFALANMRKLTKFSNIMLFSYKIESSIYLLDLIKMYLDKKGNDLLEFSRKSLSLYSSKYNVSIIGKPYFWPSTQLSYGNNTSSGLLLINIKTKINKKFIFLLF